MHTGHIAALEAKHANLENQILSEAQRPAPDQGLLSVLKKRKLQVKQEIATL